MELLNEITFSIAATKFLEGISQAYSASTTRTYANAISIFFRTLEEKGENPQTASITQLREDTILSMADYLKAFSPATEELYLHAVKSFYEYVAAEGLAGVNLSRLRILIRKAKRHHGP